DASGERLLGAVRRTLEGESPLNQELTMKLLMRLAQGDAGQSTEKAPAEADPQEDETGESTFRSARPGAPRYGGSQEAGRDRERDKVGHTEVLTPREVEVLRLLSQGQTNPQIAQNLRISRGTVKIHVQHIISKLGVSDRTQAAVRAIEAGLLGV
ncbi:MAG TPA: response regulator transcription factor, partial [Rubrobacter sp.]|nr:response regulator transcription factor [Rubrobacter sp.]